MPFQPSRVSVVVKMLTFRSEGCMFEPAWGGIFFIFQLSLRYAAKMNENKVLSF